MLNREEALLHTHLANATTGGTTNRLGAFFRAGAVTFSTADQRRNTNFFGDTANGLFKAEFQLIAKICTTLEELFGAVALLFESQVGESLVKIVVYSEQKYKIVVKGHDGKR